MTLIQDRFFFDNIRELVESSPERLYWTGKGKYQEKLTDLSKKIPSMGGSEINHIEIIRLSQRLYWDYYNNGSGNWDVLHNMIDNIILCSKSFSSIAQEIKTILDECFYEEECYECDGYGTEYCSYCDGNGLKNCDTCVGGYIVCCNDEECALCGGEGEHECYECENEEIYCYYCDGSGEEECRNCDGGRIYGNGLNSIINKKLGVLYEKLLDEITLWAWNEEYKN